MKITKQLKKIFLISLLLAQASFGEVGIASWYGIKCNGGTHTASGIPLCDKKLTAAHKTLKMGTKVEVTNLHNNKRVIVTVTDRGPHIKGRVIDLTKAAFSKIMPLDRGLCKVKLRVLKK